MLFVGHHKSVYAYQFVKCHALPMYWLHSAFILALSIVAGTSIRIQYNFVVHSEKKSGYFVTFNIIASQKLFVFTITINVVMVFITTQCSFHPWCRVVG